MQTVIKWVLLVIMVSLGGWTGFCSSPHGHVRLATSFWGLFDITCGALGGLFLGGMFVLLYAGKVASSSRRPHQTV